MAGVNSGIKTVAIVGCGIGRSHIVEGYLPASDKFKVAALCDINIDRLGAVADEFAIARRVTDFNELLAMDDIDIIDICTPPALHYEQIILALKAGKHVISEKPVVGSLSDIDDIIEIEKTAKGVLMPIFQYRFGNGVQQARAIIEAGIAGKPYIATAETLWKRGAEYYATPWRGKWKTELGGVLMGHSIHIHDMLTYLMGPVTGLFGRVATRVNPIETEDCISATCQLASGAFASLTATLGSQDQISRLRLAFENVTFESDHAPYAPGAKPWKIIPASPEIAARIDALLENWVDVPPRFTTQIGRFYDALLGKGLMPVTTADVRQALEIVTAFYHSSETHTEVTMPIGPDHPKYKSWVPSAFAS